MSQKNRWWLLFLFLYPTAVPAQESNSTPLKPHWGWHADVGVFGFGYSASAGKTRTLTSFDNQSFSIGIDRFTKNGGPNFSIQYSHTDARLRFNYENGRLLHVRIKEYTVIDGLMLTKYFNVLSLNFLSVGLAFGLGAGKLSTENFTAQTVPTLEILTFLDVRPISEISIGPIAGIRNLMPLVGGSVKYHFR